MKDGEYISGEWCDSDENFPSIELHTVFGL